jgi:hypothetical protein
MALESPVTDLFNFEIAEPALLLRDVKRQAEGCRRPRESHPDLGRQSDTGVRKAADGGDSHCYSDEAKGTRHRRSPLHARREDFSGFSFRG